MLRSMYSGISGLRNFQTKLDVIGNNISNVNTYGFKKGRVIFKDLYSQTVAGASAPTENRGGVNPKQVGLGSQIAAIDTIHGGGSTQYTGNTLDLAIEGDGYFRVQNGEGEDDVLFTRAGNFYLDKGEGDDAEEARIVDGEGRFLLDIDGEQIIVPINATSLSIGQNGAVNFVVDGELNDDPQIISLVKFNNPGGLEKVGGNYFQVSANSGNPSEDMTPLEEGLGAIKSGSLEMSNVDLAEEFTEMIVAQRGFQANTRIITTSDEILQELVNLKR
ncbi:flagellar basal body rod protein FlgG [Sporosarcina soli]|uniref:Flagellar hook protein FlgE n=1 Tax=Sporosarcina soli TaxID=334736 RepID=A0ABW0THH1_9BACL